MADCTFVTKSMLNNPIEIQLGESSDFSIAKSTADQKAKEVLSDPMLLAWFDKKSGKFAPEVVCCGDDKPTWLVYAESRGGNLAVDINNEDFIFVYRETEPNVMTH
jgi:Domain of unknown function (DUF5619)